MKEWKKDNPVLLLCNANSDLMDQDLSNLLSNAGLYNLSTIRQGLNSPATHIRGRKTIDFISGTIDLIRSMKNSRGYLSTI
eukprot:5849897-Ditylum_brightwellii.AAC.1